MSIRYRQNNRASRLVCRVNRRPIGPPDRPPAKRGPHVLNYHPIPPDMSFETRVRARLVRLLIVPTAHLQMAAASS
jgi:hypothetical protein